MFLLAKNSMIKKIENYFDRLFPIDRSITGKGYQKSLDIISEIIPLKKINFPTNKKIFDWKIPKEWNVNEAYIKDSNGKIINIIIRILLNNCTHRNFFLLKLKLVKSGSEYFSFNLFMIFIFSF